MFDINDMVADAFMTYDDLLFRLGNIIEALKIKINDKTTTS